MNITLKSNESWLLNLVEEDGADLTGRVNKARLVVKRNKEDIDTDAVVNQEVAVTDPSAFDVLFNVPPSVTHDLDGQYYYEVWAYLNDKSDAIFCDDGTVIFTNPLLDIL